MPPPPPKTPQIAPPGSPHPTPTCLTPPPPTDPPGPPPPPRGLRPTVSWGGSWCPKPRGRPPPPGGEESSLHVKCHPSGEHIPDDVLDEGLLLAREVHRYRKFSYPLIAGHLGERFLRATGATGFEKPIVLQIVPETNQITKK